METKRRPKGANGNGRARLRQNGSWEWRESLADGRLFSAYGKTQAEAKARCLGPRRPHYPTIAALSRALDLAPNEVTEFADALKARSKTWRRQSQGRFQESARLSV